MRISEGLDLLFRRTGTKQGKFAKEVLGHASHSALSAAKSRENLTVDYLIRICQALDYEVVIRPKSGPKGYEDIVLDVPRKEAAATYKSNQQSE